ETSFRALPEKPEILEPRQPDAPSHRTVIVVDPGADLVAVADEWVSRYPEFRGAVNFTPGGTREKWTQRNPPNTFEQSFTLIGQTIDSHRIDDITAIVATVHKNRSDGLKLIICGRGQAGVLAAIAALLVPESVAEVRLVDPPTSHRDSPHFLNVDRVLDL